MTRRRLTIATSIRSSPARPSAVPAIRAVPSVRMSHGPRLESTASANRTKTTDCAATYARLFSSVLTGTNLHQERRERRRFGNDPI